MKSEESLNAFYCGFDRTGDAEEQLVVDFWKQTISEYAYSVEQKFTVRTDHLVKRFTLHDRIPCGLPQIIEELHRKESLATREEIMQGDLFDKNGG